MTAASRVHAAGAALLLLLGCRRAPAPSELYPPAEPRESGWLRVSDLHELYWERVGQPGGSPVIVLHSGPGGSAAPALRRYFDPARFDVLLFDQRGAQRSRPQGEWRENTTADLLADIDRLREHAGFTRKPILFGESWGSTLALAYAERDPQRVAGLVLHGVFLCTQEEIDFLYHGAVSTFFPEAWERLKLVLPRPDDPSYPRQLFELMTGDDPRERETAVESWSFYEARIASVQTTDERTEQELRERGESLEPLALLESYYRTNGCFLREGQLLQDVERIANIPTFIVQGRYDMIAPPLRAYLLTQRLRNVQLELLDAAGHSADDPGVSNALLRAVEWVAGRADTAELPPESAPDR